MKDKMNLMFPSFVVVPAADLPMRLWCCILAVALGLLNKMNAAGFWINLCLEIYATIVCLAYCWPVNVSLWGSPSTCDSGICGGVIPNARRNGDCFANAVPQRDASTFS
jgi:hypothetical protein